MIDAKTFFLYRKKDLFEIMIKRDFVLFKSEPWILEESHKNGEKPDFLNRRTVRSNSRSYGCCRTIC